MDKARVRDYITEYVETELPWFIERELKVSETERRGVILL